MGVMRNRKVKVFLLSLLLLTAVEILVLHAFFSENTGAVRVMAAAAAVNAAVAVVYLVTEIVQSKRINRFHQKIEDNLHGQRETELDDLREGEFESLQASISKMLIALMRSRTLWRKKKRS